MPGISDGRRSRKPGPRRLYFGKFRADRTPNRRVGGSLIGLEGVKGVSPIPIKLGGRGGHFHAGHGRGGLFLTQSALPGGGSAIVG
eukprot:521110-Hanusia_phi.AAC.1